MQRTSNVSVLIWQPQGRCYTQVLEIQGAIVKDLVVVKKLSGSVELDDSHVHRIAQRFLKFETTFAGISQQMKNTGLQSDQKAKDSDTCDCCREKPRKSGTYKELMYDTSYPMID